MMYSDNEPLDIAILLDIDCMPNNYIRNCKNIFHMFRQVEIKKED